MDLAKALGDIFRQELQAQLTPLHAAVRRMEDGLDALEMLRSATFRLAPLTSRLGAMAGVRTPSAIPEPAARRVVAKAKAKRGAAKRGRPLADGAAGRATMAKAPVVVKRARVEEGTRACAVMGCKRPSRSKGYCSAHYQKLRLLMRTNRRPAEWVDDAKPQSVREVKLPRGRAASKALQEATPKRSSPPAVPPKPKAWVRKKGKGDKVSLH
jgi:hypothetical protein